MNHGLLCVAGAVVALAGHVPGRPGEWAPHGVALVVMAAVATGAGGDPVRLCGAILLLGAGLCLATGDPLLPRLPAVADTVAMAALLALAPSASHQTTHQATDQADDGASASMLLIGAYPTGARLAACLVVLVGWAALTAAVWRRAPRTDGRAGRPASQGVGRRVGRFAAVRRPASSSVMVLSMMAAA